MKKIKENNLMNIAELKEKKISELTKLAKKLKVDGAAGMRKQELMFALLQSQIEKMASFSVKAPWRFYRTVSVSYDHRIPITCRVRMTFMYPRPKYGVLI